MTDFTYHYSPPPASVGTIRLDLKTLSLRQLVDMQHYIDKLIQEKTTQAEKAIYSRPEHE